MGRKIAAITLAISFLAMATSGMMMFVIEKPSFSIQMHPVHKLFGIIMIAAVIAHLSFNYRMLINYFKAKSMAIYGSALVVILVLLYGVVINNTIPTELAKQMDEAAAQVE